MRILHVSPVVYMDRLFASYDLAGTQAKHGHVVAIVGASANKCSKIINVRQNLTVFLVPSIQFPPEHVSSASFVLGLSDLMTQFRPDIIHLQTHLNLTAIKTIFLAKKMSIPVVTTIHGVRAKINRIIDSVQWGYLNTFGQIVFEGSNRIICLTKYNSAELMKAGCSPNKISLIPNGVDTDLFKQGDNIAENLVVWHGRLVGNKGLEYLIEAAAMVVQSGFSEAKFVIIGDGPLKPMLVGMTRRLGITRNVVFVGRIPLNEVAEYLRQATLYVFCSLSEGMPWALLEAMACGKAVVGSDIPGVNDVITDKTDGILVPSKDSVALAEGIITLLQNKPLRMRLGQSARELVVKKYDWEKISARVEQTYVDAAVKY